MLHSTGISNQIPTLPQGGLAAKRYKALNTNAMIIIP
jgi:hypothetical protein